MSNAARRARTILLAAIGAILLSGLSGCVVWGGYGWHHSHGGGHHGGGYGGGCR